MLTSAEQQHLTHRRGAHFAHNTLRRTAGMCRGLDYSYRFHPPFCDSCPAGNARYPHLGAKRTRASQPMELVHCDLWGPSQVPSINGNKYVICFVDDFSREVAVYFLKRKSHAAQALRDYIDAYSTPLQIRIRQVQSDGGGEFHGEFADVCRVQGIKQRFSAPEMQQQNSVAERTWGTIISAALRMLHDSQLPAKYWEDAVTTATYTKNRLYSTALDGQTPHEALWSEQPDLSLLRVWGSPAYVHLPHGKHVRAPSGTRRKRKLDARTRPAVFVGYADNFKAWKFYDPTANTYFVSRMATFNERINDDTPTLTLLRHPQPADLQVSEWHKDILQPGSTSAKASDAKDTSATCADPPRTRSRANDTLPPPPAPPRPRRTTRVPSTSTSPPHSLEGRKACAHDQASEHGDKYIDGNGVRWMATPNDGMTVIALARYFNVEAKSYRAWLGTFSPFGHDSDGAPERMCLTHSKKHQTRFKLGTHVPVPIGDTTFARLHAETSASEHPCTRSRPHLTTKEAASMFMAFALTSTAAYHTLVTPKNYGEVRKSAQHDKWQEAMNAEYASLISLGTWELVKKRPGDKVIGSMWAFKLKENPDGSVSRYKARLVARGDQQAESSYGEIFAPVIKFVTLRILLAIACVMDWDIQQVDIGNAYCNAFVVEDDILMRQPAGFEQVGPNGEELVCRLRKSLYGLKQAGREWNKLLNSWLVNSKWKFTRAKADYCLYHTKYQGKVLLVGCYVDDLIITGSCPRTIRRFKADIAKRFKISDLGELKWILGMEVERDRKNKKLTLHQRKYIRDITTTFKMQDCHPRNTPADPSARMSKEDSPKNAAEHAACDLTKYRSMVGKLVYLMVASEPSISYAVSQLSRYFSCPGPKHFIACRWAIAYIKGLEQTQGLTFHGAQGFNLHAYCDSDWAGCPDTRRSTSGYVVMFAGAAVAWISKRQPTVALSSAEAEYVTACLAAQEVQWIRQLLAELEVPCLDGPTTVYSDSQSAMHMANNPTAGRAKHMDIKYHFVKDACENGVVAFKYCHTNEQAADLLTKALARPKLVKFRDMVTGQTIEMHIMVAMAA